MKGEGAQGAGQGSLEGWGHGQLPLAAHGSLPGGGGMTLKLDLKEKQPNNMPGRGE